MSHEERIDAVIANLRYDMLTGESFKIQSFTPTARTGTIRDADGRDVMTCAMGPVSVHVIIVQHKDRLEPDQSLQTVAIESSR